MSKKLLDLGIQKKLKQTNLSWQEIAEQHSDGRFANGEMLRCWVKSELKKIGQLKSKANDVVGDNKEEVISNFKSQSEIHSDGSQSSSKLIRLSLQQNKDSRYLLEAHGFDPDEWEIVNAKNSEWTGYSKTDGQFPQYSSKITVRVRKDEFSLEKLNKIISQVKPVEINIEKIYVEDKKLLEIPLFDMHIGISNYEYYKSTQSRIMERINSRKWEEILFVIGQDLFHNNDFKGNTANGTHIESVDMEKAWEDCCKFYEPIIKQAIEKQSKHVKVVYSKGNHDETISWAFVKYLKCRFPEAEFEDSFEERKIHIFEGIFIGITHGDKANNKDLANIFIKEYPLDWANSSTKEIHKGHYHVEEGKDIFGTMVRTLATKNKTDKWHSEKGFIGAHKRFMLFEYSAEELDSIHYV